MFPSAAPRVAAGGAPHATSAAPRSAPNPAPVASGAPPSSSPRSSAAPQSKPSAGVAVARTVDIVKPAGAYPSLAEPESDLDMLDEPTRLRADGLAALLGTAPQVPAVPAGPPPVASAVPWSAPAPVRSAPTPPMPFAVSPRPSEELEAERTEPRVSGVVAHPDASLDESLGGEVSERSESGRRWVVIAAVFLSLVVIALAALAR
jgi:hypothetical protein